MSTFTSTNSTVRFTDADGEVSFTASRPAVTFTAGYQSVTGGGGGSSVIEVSVYDALGGPLCFAVSAVDGTATTVTVITPQYGALADGDIPAGWVAVSVAATDVPIAAVDMLLNGDFGPAGDPTNTNTVVVPAGPSVGVYALVQGALDEPWPEIASPVGTVVIGDGAITYIGQRIVDKFETILPSGVGDQVDADGRVYAPEWATIDADGDPYLDMTPGGASLAWVTSDLNNLAMPTGLDVRATLMFASPPSMTTYQYMEVLTQIAPAHTGGDNFEAAILWPDASGPDGSLTPGVPLTFWESTITGGTGETSKWAPARLEAGHVVSLRWTVDTANSTMTMWRAVPADYSVTGDVTAGGVVWRPVYTETGADWASMKTINDTWHIGLRFWGRIYSLEAYHYGGARIIGMTPAAITAAGDGATTVTCAEGVEFTAADCSVVVPGSSTATVDAVSNVATSTILGRVTAGSGNSEELTAAQVRSLISVPPLHEIDFVTNGWYSTRGHAGTSGIYSQGAAARGCLAPVYLQAGNYDRLALQQTVTGTATYRVALYPSNATTGLPDGETPLVDGGDINMSTTTGLRELTISTTVPADGWYWAAVKVESRTSDPTVRTFYNLSGVSSFDVPLGSQTSAATDSSAGVYVLGRRINGGWTSGAFGTCPTTATSDGVIKVLVRKSA